MKKGIGAAPFAIVAALILALAGGLWATQPAQAQDGDLGDVILTVTPVIGGSTNSFINPDGEDVPFGPGGRVFELRTTVTGAQTLEKAFADAHGDNEVRGALGQGRSSWVEFQAATDGVDGTIDTANATSNVALDITVSGEASLSDTSTLTSATCQPQAGLCQFPVYSSGNPGDFSVTATPASGTLLTSSAGDPATKNGQWVGAPVSVTAITKPGSAFAAAIPDDVRISPAVFLSGAETGLDTANDVGFLFQLTDSAGQVAMNTSDSDRSDDVRVDVTTDTGDKVNLVASTLSTGPTDSGDRAYLEVTQESGLGAGYPDVQETDQSTGGLIGIALATAVGNSSIGRIMLDLGGGNTFAHAFSASGAVDADMSSVSAISSGDENLAAGGAHVRMLNLRDKNGIPVPGSTEDITVADTSDEAGLGFAWGKDDAAVDTALLDTDNSLTGPATSAGAAEGAYPLTIAALTETEVGATYSFSVQIGTDATKAKKTDADDYPLEAHVGSGITNLSITSVSTLAGEELLAGNGGDTQTVDAGDSRLLTIVLTALGSDDLAPANGQKIMALSTSGGNFVGESETDSNGEASIRYVFGGDAKSTTLIFSGGTDEVVLIVGAGDDAAVDAGPVIYSLVSGMGATYVSWQGGDASSSEFENVAGLVVVWKWTGNAWVRYGSDPSLPASLKTDFALTNGDVLFVVSDGPVDITLG